MSPSRTTRRVSRTAVLALVLGAGLGACSDAEDPEPSGPRPELAQPSLPAVASGVAQRGVPRLINLILTDGRVSGVTEVVEVPRGTPVRLTVIADVADQLVVEGYDLRAQLTVSEPVQVSLVLDRAGDFPVRLSGEDRVLTTLRVP